MQGYYFKRDTLTNNIRFTMTYKGKALTFVVSGDTGEDISIYYNDNIYSLSDVGEIQD